MNHFKKYCLGNISNIYNQMPYDSLLYCKTENVISSALASIGTMFCSQQEYYRTEGNNIDITRFDENGDVFSCESKYVYASDLLRNAKLTSQKQDDPRSDSDLIDEYFNKYYVNQNISTNSKIGVSRCDSNSVNYLDKTLCDGIKQIIRYTTEKSSRNNRMVILNIVFRPYGTSGLNEKNSGLKYVSPSREKFDAKLFELYEPEDIPKVITCLLDGKNPGDLNTVGESCAKKTAFGDVNCCFDAITPLSTLHGFNYYMITLGYKVPDHYIYSP